MISVSSGLVGLKSLMTKLHKSSHYSPSAALLMLILTQHSTVNRVILHQISLELALSTFAGQIGLQMTLSKVFSVATVTFVLSDGERTKTNYSQSL